MVAHEQATPLHEPRVVVIGGGNGCSALYPEIAAHTPNATAIVSMSDDGGSTGRLMQGLEDMPSVGDLRNVMMAASANEVVRDMRRHRLRGTQSLDGTRSALHGHSAGNLMLAQCLQEFGTEEGLDAAHQMWSVQGRVLPATLDAHRLMMDDGGKIIEGEHRIDVHAVQSASPKVWLHPAPRAYAPAAEAITKADGVVIAAGSMYTSLLAALLVGDIRDALCETTAPIISVINLSGEAHQTKNWHVADFIQALRRHKIPVDYGLFNDAVPDAGFWDRYAREGEIPVDCSPERFAELRRVKAIGADILSRVGLESNPNDAVSRGAIRHDAARVREHVWDIIATHQEGLYGTV